MAEDKEVTITNKDVYAKIEDHTMKVSVSKNDEEGNLLPDAVLQVIDESGIIVDEWTTTDSVHVITDLIAGKTYKLHEKAAPEGFMIADDVTFKTEGTDINVTMVDKKTDVTVKKVNPFGFGIDGAVLQIIDSNGDVVKEFTSSAKGNNFRGLPKGEYTLHEKEAGEGFELAEDVKFTVGDESITVKMVDEFTNIKLPLTGGTPLNMLIFAIPLILLGAGMYIFGRRRKQTEK